MSTKSFDVLRLGRTVSASLDGKNAANLPGMASFILQVVDHDIASGDKLTLYKITAEQPFGPYTQYRGQSVQNKDLAHDNAHVGQLHVHTNAYWYSFPPGGKWTAHVVRTVDNVFDVLDPLVKKMFPREGRLVMCGEVQIQQILHHVFPGMTESRKTPEVSRMKYVERLTEALLTEGDRFVVVGAPRMQKGFFGVLDTQNDSLKNSVQSKKAAQDLADQYNQSPDNAGRLSGQAWK